MDAARRAKLAKMLLVDKGPSVREQSGFVNWGQMSAHLGQPFDTTHIPLNKLRQMRRDPMIAFGLQFVKLPLVRAPWFIDCEDQQIAAFVKESLGLIFEDLMMKYSLKYDYGFQAIVKNFAQQPVDWTYTDTSDPNNPVSKPVWTSTVDPIIWKPFTSVPPELAYPEWDDATGEFDGFTRGTMAVPGAATQKNRPDRVDVEHALWVTNEKASMHGSIWGYPRIGYAYRYWWSYWYGWALRDRYMERSSDPSTIVRYPDDVLIDDQTGQPVDLRSIAQSLGMDVRAGHTITLPNTLIRGDDGKVTQIPEWSIEYLQPPGNVASEFQTQFDYLDVMKLRSILVPEQALIQGSGGANSSGVAEQLADFFTEAQATEMVEFADMINRYMIPQLVAVNFPTYKGKCRWVSRGFSSADHSLVMQLLTLVGQADPNALEVDVRELMQQMSVPVKTPEQVKAEKDQEIKDQQQQLDMQTQQQITLAKATAQLQPGTGPTSASAGPQVVPNTGGTNDKAPAKKPPGTTRGPQNTDWQQFQFSEDEYPLGPFAEKIKDLRYYKDDDAALKAASFIRDTWAGAFAEYYAMIADHVAGLNLSDDPIKEDPAHVLINATIAAAEAIFKAAVAKSVKAYQTIASSAAKKEMKELKLDIDWKMDNSDVRSWMALHGAQLVRHVTDSTRNELQVFLGNQLATDKTPLEISKAIDENFSQWPDWKAERLARSEARDAYNAGTLLAAQKSGITHVQASDASGGRNTHTDRECIERNGKIFPVAEALHIQDHPNGTLAWRPIPAGLTLAVERHADEDGPLAFFDESEGIIHFAESIMPDQEQKFVTAVVDALRGE